MENEGRHRITCVQNLSPEAWGEVIGTLGTAEYFKKRDKIVIE